MNIGVKYYYLPINMETFEIEEELSLKDDLQSLDIW